MIKSYTDIEQSKKLAEFLPLESADMTYYACVKDWKGNPVEPKWGKSTTLTKEELALPCSNFQEYKYIPCWSLAVLMKILHRNEEDIVSLSYGGYKDGEYILNWCLDYEFEDGDYKKTFADNPVDACVDMIEKLNELNLL